MRSTSRAIAIIFICITALSGITACSTTSAADKARTDQKVDEAVNKLLASQAPQQKTAPAAQANAAGDMIRAFTLGGDATANQYIASNVLFNSNAVMAAVRGCRITSPWETFTGGMPISSELTCPDGDLVAVDVYLDSTNRVTKASGQGAKAKHSFDSTK